MVISWDPLFLQSQRCVPLSFLILVFCLFSPLSHLFLSPAVSLSTLLIFSKKQLLFS